MRRASGIHLENIDAKSSYCGKANQSVKLLRTIRHWVNEHKTPPFLVRTGCVAEYKDWMLETRGVARTGFRYYRSKASNFQEYPKQDRAAARVRQMLIFNRIEGRQADAQKDLLNCFFDNMPYRLRLLLFYESLANTIAGAPE